MTVQVIRTADAEQLFATVRDADFGWTVTGLPGLLAPLGWKITTELPGDGAIAQTPWGIPEADAQLLYEGGTVESFTIRLTSRAGDDPADRLGVVDAFAGLTELATRLLGAPTATFQGRVPRTQWRGATATMTLHNTGERVLAVWCRNEYQDFNDSVGRF